ncbi:hypothetical protein A2962_00265 [Candidatus Woesebacteria bacterium RIFCSPLOWO2_01_FULL_39_61]|uniref:Uncharacterized protein n=1 Tax=Candidatus Woesebacteria bacterium RIFCSPHIGHO2_02_FULL_39_13 TaxID=1802505 RepID=A0A1F7Z2A8_9BACT|nr:MAG: hypothetical protein A2692_05805 [Candidatus Woesebacteria bacterium RIFCSPHIGHO2_01_FULL_39_95]OGM33773.1 MAG: hypothetical protein A3D01_02270 [Candidatus Woesebacteria bacterium RIFCSPHIGHO2_02_FULL_39_13]OGM37590.1 MAG: hypothetical protein A3E13_01415 [Candidatus Woesebacteria bacterium RIFCSPHIGHO2_12_FULL_40_20]OGM65513.1 MAG: hypothetical protein A2962_00265 [Candidatus Woesebacteria bacterium RIFCSPLOWO2_01_FULL_39_61]OGM72516.1 MAG: hypothetical protein A3H19_01060 [Candidatus
MAFEEEGSVEKTTSSKITKSSNMTLQKAIEMGEYDPEYLATFPEWHELSRHMQFQYIREALDNRNKHLITQWAEINNMLDFRLKPNLAMALKNIEAQLKKLDKDKERLYLEYSK